MKSGHVMAFVFGILFASVANSVAGATTITTNTMSSYGAEVISSTNELTVILDGVAPTKTNQGALGDTQPPRSRRVRET